MSNQNNWSCFLASFARCLNEPMEKLIREIGHDGSEILWPERRPPNCYRGFHHQELIDCCLRRGVSVTCVEALPVLAGPPDKLIYPHEVAYLRIYQYIRESKRCVIGGEIHGNRHAVACIRQTLYCPNQGQQCLSVLDDWSIKEVYILAG